MTKVHEMTNTFTAILKFLSLTSNRIYYPWHSCSNIGQFRSQRKILMSTMTFQIIKESFHFFSPGLASHLYNLFFHKKMDNGLVTNVCLLERDAMESTKISLELIHSFPDFNRISILGSLIPWQSHFLVFLAFQGEKYCYWHVKLLNKGKKM